MKDPNKRELMKQAYKLLEDYETPTAEESYWAALRDACEAFCKAWDGCLHRYAVLMAVAVFDGLEAEWKQTQPKGANE